MNDCENTVYVTGGDSFAIDIKCGTWYGGYKEFCDECVAKLGQRFPQGWRYTPGDVCKHGVYVGGCGADLMCGACEQGD